MNDIDKINQRIDDVIDRLNIDGQPLDRIKNSDEQCVLKHFEMRIDFVDYLGGRIEPIEEKMHELASDVINLNAITIAEINKKINELESQLCGAKKKRIDGLEERVKAIEERLPLQICTEHDLVYRPEEHDVKRSEPKREPWKPKQYEMFYCIAWDRVWDSQYDAEFKEEQINSWNCFQTKEQAEAFLSKIKKLREDFNG